MCTYLRNILLYGITFILLLQYAHAQVQTEKPWTYWWWMGSAVNENDIRKQLLEFKQVGIGGVHIIPIYGARGFEKQFKDFLSPQWIKYYELTLKEAAQLGLGVDLSTGSGWPFGGPNVSAEMNAKKFVVKDGQITFATTGQKVKRAAPGGEGYVLDPFDKNAMLKYLIRFDSTIAKNKQLRAVYYDSYEAFGADWTTDFKQEFIKRRGYDLSSVEKVFTNKDKSLNRDLVSIDYQQTLAEMLAEASDTWAKWSDKNGFKTRYQAHGSPGNLLDLYALASIPETESFGSSAFPIPYLRVDKNYSAENFGRPNTLAMKFASSAANITGKKLVSSETCTWLAEHFNVSLSQVKPQVDELFTAGINHVFFHGTTYSPSKEAYPGWLFYASTNFGPTSHFYKELPLLNAYIKNCQQILQSCKPDNDVLVYFPVQDIWADEQSATGALHLLNVHHPDKWLLALPFGKLITGLQNKGFSFDYISDAQLEKLAVKNKRLTVANTSYKALLIPACSYMPQATLKKLISLAQKGVKVIFDKNLPERTMGYAGYRERSAAFEKDKAQIKTLQNCIVTNDMQKQLRAENIIPEMLANEGLSFIRKKNNGKTVYFMVNLKDTFKSGWINLSAVFKGDYIFYNPLDGEKKRLAIRKKGKQKQFYLTLLPGQSCFITEENGKAAGKEKMTDQAFRDLKISTNWTLQFLTGKPAYKKEYKLDSSKSWTSLSDTASFFSGTAKYTGSFSVTASVLKSQEQVLYLGDVRESARVRINGKAIGTAWSLPFQLHIPPNTFKTELNKLEIEVTNLSANYMRMYDREQPGWKKFYDVNFVNIQYKKFNAQNWPPMPSGLNTNNLTIKYR